MAIDSFDPQRRLVLQGVAGAAVWAALAAPLRADQVDDVLPGTLLSACDDLNGNHYIASLRPEGSIGFQIPVPLRAHDSCATPDRTRAFFFSRRPGHLLFVVNLQDGRLIQTLEASPGRHFYGHGVVSADGQWLFATEQAYESGQGLIGIYRLGDTVKREGEIPSHGMDPHELQWLSDGKTLVVANGGIRTHPAQNRENLNPDTMVPSLSYVRVNDGALLESHTPPHHQMSLHHLDVSTRDQVIVGVQYHGALTDDVSLVGSHRRGNEIQWWQADELTQLRMQQYTASVAVDQSGTQAVVSCPRGNGIAVWDMATGDYLHMLPVRDAAGLNRQWQQGGWVATNGDGEVVRIAAQHSHRIQPVGHYPLRWDNHATLL